MKSIKEKYSKYSLKQLNQMWAVLPKNNPNKDEIAEEIERRVDSVTDAQGNALKKGQDYSSLSIEQLDELWNEADEDEKIKIQKVIESKVDDNSDKDPDMKDSVKKALYILKL